jgi:hypothetical protein
MRSFNHAITTMILVTGRNIRTELAGMPKLRVQDTQSPRVDCGRYQPPARCCLGLVSCRPSEQRAASCRPVRLSEVKHYPRWQAAGRCGTAGAAGIA